MAIMPTASTAQSNQTNSLVFQFIVFCILN